MPTPQSPWIFLTVPQCLGDNYADIALLCCLEEHTAFPSAVLVDSNSAGASFLSLLSANRAPQNFHARKISEPSLLCNQPGSKSQFGSVRFPLGHFRSQNSL